ncbi:nucleotidyltransferase family protein [Cytobacillus massiliigabonensis]|uniref:nucleotidyltransferase family protein n=1 Tax=Cytobacillus massiliigabonensis TaxID=1871011 RepID=UPI000C852FD2|nr:nucleotidyltransferase family protein [Cytobacillus massiliigabonensis]
MLKSKEDIIAVIEEDLWMMELLRTAKELKLPDWWICAGFVRSKIWDVLHGFSERTRIPDIDVIYFDQTNLDESEEKRLEKELHSRLPFIPWSVKNQARMHVINHFPPYLSSVDAISKFPETVTALGVKLDDSDNLILTAPCGIKDVLMMEVNPTPFFKETKELALIYEQRLKKKNWSSVWNKITVTHI